MRSSYSKNSQLLKQIFKKSRERDLIEVIKIKFEIKYIIAMK